MVAWFAPFLTSVWWHIGKYEIKNIFFKIIQKSLFLTWNLSSGTLFWWKKYPTLPIYVYYYFWTLWFRYRFRYRPKVSANYSFGFGIGPKPKWWFRSFTRVNQGVGVNQCLDKFWEWSKFQLTQIYSHFHIISCYIDMTIKLSELKIMQLQSKSKQTLK